MIWCLVDFYTATLWVAVIVSFIAVGLMVVR